MATSVSAAPLAGIAVVVTRPARQAAAFAEKIAVLGATPILFPAIAILPPEDRAALERVHARLADYDFAFFVSANAVEYGAPDKGRWPRGLPAFAPGPGTAEALAAAGVDDVRVPSASLDSEGLLALPELAHPAGKRAVIFRGAGGRELLGDTLAARGAIVEYVSCYRRALPSGGARGLLDALGRRRRSVLTITSSEGLDNLWAMLGREDRARLAALPLFAPHPRIAAHARTLGFTVHQTGAGDAGLIAGLLEWAGRGGAAEASG